MQFLDADSKKPEWSMFISKSNHLNGLITVVIQAYAQTSNAEEAEGEWFYEELKDLLKWTPKIYGLFIIGDRDGKVGSQETPGVTGKFGLGVQNEARQRLTEFCQENTLVITNTLFHQHKRLYTWTSPDGHIKIRLIIFFVAKDGEALYSQQKQGQELTVAQIKTPYCSIQT